MTTLQSEIAERGLDLPEGWDQPCEGSVHHSPTPLMCHCFDLAVPFQTAVEDPDDATDPVWLCGVCADNLLVFLLLCQEHDVPWETLRRFGNKIRDLGRRVRAHQESH